MLVLRQSYYVNFEHVQNLTTSLQTLLRSYHAFTTLILFLPHLSSSHYALDFLRERSKDVVGTWPGVTGGIMS